LSGRETAITTIAQSEPIRVTVGVDTHGDVHVAYATDQLGRHLATTRIATTPRGYRALLDWARGLGQVAAFGVEGTGCYGAGLARFLGAQGQVVVEVNRPDRQARRRRGKSDPVDAEAAARAVLAGQATAVPKIGDSMVEMVRCLRVARATAMKARTQSANALRALLVTAPVELREQLRDLDPSKLAATAARLRPGAIVTPTAATKLALRTVAEPQLALTGELTTLDAELDRLTARAAPALRELCGVGAEVAGALLVTAGDDPARLRSDAAFSMLCGASPIEASSGKTVRHRLNRGGDRQANTALYRIVVVRRHVDPAVHPGRLHHHRAHRPPRPRRPPTSNSYCSAGCASSPSPSSATCRVHRPQRRRCRASAQRLTAPGQAGRMRRTTACVAVG
jgi:transposase